MSKRKSLQDIAADLHPWYEQAPILSEWKHLNGRNYTVVCHVVTSDDEMVPLVIYEPWEEEGSPYPVRFARPASEFLDGRFERITE